MKNHTQKYMKQNKTKEHIEDIATKIGAQKLYNQEFIP